jgi:hypothetical protein
MSTYDFTARSHDCDRCSGGIQRPFYKIDVTQQLRRILIGVTTAVVLAGCGSSSGSGGTPPPPPPPPPPPGISEAEAVRFLRQASFGPTEQDVAAVIAMGYEDWIDAQITTPATSQVAILNRLGTVDDETGHDDRVEAWLESALTGPDQLRQRIAFALSEIMVVSQQSGLFAQPYGTANYYDLLLTSAFGNFRQLMEDVTLSPAMGVYLSMLGNQKPNPAFNIRPDENYARELMQLFTIGLVELNQDGTVRRDAQNQPLPTYDQDIIEGFAHVFTGWTFGGSPSFLQPSFDYLQPMQAFPFWHDAATSSWSAAPYKVAISTGRCRCCNSAGPTTSMPAGWCPRLPWINTLRPC